MEADNDAVWVSLSREEAWEMLVRCLSSDHGDGPCISAAINKLAQALESRHADAIARCIS